MRKTSTEFEPKTMLYQWQYVRNQYRIRKYRRSSWRYPYSSLAGDTHTQAKPVLKSIEYLLILILIARIGNHTHDYLSIQVLSCHPRNERSLSAMTPPNGRAPRVYTITFTAWREVDSASVNLGGVVKWHGFWSVPYVSQDDPQPFPRGSGRTASS